MTEVFNIEEPGTVIRRAEDLSIVDAADLRVGDGIELTFKGLLYIGTVVAIDLPCIHLEES